MTDRAEGPEHVLSGYWDVLVIRARSDREAAREAARRDLWLHCHRREVDATLTTPQLIWSSDVRVPLLQILRVYVPEIRELAARRGINRVRVFGSVARGDEQEDSDVDLLVDAPDGYGAGLLAGFAAEVSDLLGRRVDVATERLLRDDVRDAALAEARGLL